jgi:hypothetical protein
MTKERKIIQFTLLSIGLLLILATYIFYPNFKEKQAGFDEKALSENEIFEEDSDSIKDEETNTFTNVEYKGFYNLTNPFSIKSDKAHILKEDSDIIYMTNMKAIILMNNGKTVIITSDKGRYNKQTYDSFFEENVKATDSETTILSDNLDLIASEDKAIIYNDVTITNNEKGSLKADKIDYNFTTEFYKVSMYNNKNVKIKIYE